MKQTEAGKVRFIFEIDLATSTAVIVRSYDSLLCTSDKERFVGLNLHGLKAHMAYGTVDGFFDALREAKKEEASQTE